MSDSPSPEYTVTFAPGAYDVLRDCLLRVEQTMRSCHDATSYEDLAERNRAAMDQAWSLLRNLGYSLLASNTHDGNVRLNRDGQHSLFFSYDSGYHGAMILHESPKGPAHGTWSVHT